MADDLNTTRRTDDMTTNTGRTDAVRDTTADPDYATTNRTTTDREAKDTNPDAITGAPGSHPVGTGTGAAGVYNTSGSSSSSSSNYDTGAASSSSMSSMPDTRGTTGAGSMGGTGLGTGNYGMGSSVSGNTASTNSAGTERRDLEDNTG